MEITEKVKALLKDFDIKIIKHKPCNSAIESCEERGIPLQQGVKSLILEADDEIIEVLISGDKRIDLHKLKEKLNVKNACLADKDL